MSAHTSSDTHDHPQVGMKIMYVVWVGLLIATLVEVFLAYLKMDLHVMLAVLIGLSLAKSFGIMAYFMHLKFERAVLVLTLIPALCMCLVLMNVFYPDALRIVHIGVFK